MEKQSVARLIGAPPGYVGYEEGGQLTEAVRRRPYAVVLFDEIEKAHADVFNVLLQVLEDGRLTDGKGRVVDFSNAMLIMTSNIGSRAIVERLATSGSIAQSPEEEEAAFAAVQGAVRRELQQTYRPEVLNRLDEIVTFRPLKKPEVQEIAEHLVGRCGGEQQGQGSLSGHSHQPSFEGRRLALVQWHIESFLVLGQA